MFQFATKFAPRKKKISRARKAGFRAGEPWLKKKHLEQIDETIDTASSFAMDYVPHFPNKANLSVKHLEAFVRLYRELECTVAVIHQPMLRGYGSQVREVASGSLTFAVENGRLRGVPFHKWASKNEFLTLDVEHLWKHTLEDCHFHLFENALDKFIGVYGHKVRHVHMPGYVPGSEEHRPSHTNPEFACAVWERLRTIQFQGMAVSEKNRKFQKCEYLRNDRVLFEQWRTSDQNIPDPVLGWSL